MAKQISYDAEARENIRNGVKKLARAVKVTLGPRGRNVIIEKSFGSPTVTKDGVTVSKEVDLEDPLENMGAQLVKEVASRTNDGAGDGTTTATVLAANNASEIGAMIAEAMDKVGKDGVITVEEGKSLTTEVEWVEGMQFDKGYLSPHFITDMKSMECVFEDAYVLVHEKKISSIKDMIPLLEEVMRNGKPLVIIAEDIEGEALATLVVNRLRGAFPCVAVKAPGFGDRRKAMMEDIAILTGATPVMDATGASLETVKISDLGKAKKIVVTKDNTTVIEGGGKKGDIKGRIEQIKAEMEATSSDYDTEKLQERLAKLAGGVAQVNVGAATESEMKERKARVEDALHATRAAVEEGIVPGGGVALLSCQKAIEALELAGDEFVGSRIVHRAVEFPIRQIAENAGQNGAVVVREILSKGTKVGYNADTDTYEDLVKAGVIDPTKVTRMALQNASSVASLLLTTDALVSDLPAKEDAGACCQHGGHPH